MDIKEEELREAVKLAQQLGKPPPAGDEWQSWAMECERTLGNVSETVRRATLRLIHGISLAATTDTKVYSPPDCGRDKTDATLSDEEIARITREMFYSYRERNHGRVIRSPQGL